MKKFFVILVLLVCLGANAAEPVRIACIGDSITFGYGLRSPFTDSWPPVLQKMLGEGYVVHNFGFSARTMANSGDRPYMKEQMYARAKEFLPDIVIIMLGTNDVKPQNWPQNDFEESYNIMLDELEALPSKPKIFVCHPATVQGERWGITDSTIVAGIMPVVNRIAEERQLYVIDAHSATANYAEHFPDFIHPDEVASEAIAETVFKALGDCGFNPARK